MVGRRYELLANTEDRGSVLWPKWSMMVVQLRRREMKSHKVRLSYAVVLAPPLDIVAEPTGITMPKCRGILLAAQDVNPRCTEAHCLYRTTALNAAEAQAVGKDDEIYKEDRINILDSMLDQTEELDEGGGFQGEGEEAGDLAADPSTTRRHDCIVNLWPSAHATCYYEEVIAGLAFCRQGVSWPHHVRKSPSRPVARMLEEFHAGDM